MRIILCVTLALGALGLNEQASVSPVQKVISMLEDMHAKGKSEMENAQKVHQEYLDWERDTLSDNHYTIKNLNRDIEKQSAAASASSAASDEEATIIADTNGEINRLNEELASDKDACESDWNEYLATAADYSDMIDALTRAVTVMKSQNHNRPQALLQVSDVVARLPSSLDKTSLMNYLAGHVEVDTPAKPSLLSSGTEEEETGAPQSNAYDATGGRIVEMLQGLKEKAVDEKNDLDTGAKNSQHACNMMAQDKSAELSSKETDLDRAKIAKAEADKKNADATKKLNEDLTLKAEAQKYQNEVKSTGAVKRAEFDADNKLRGEELQALAAATEVIKNQVVGHTGHLNFAQLRAVGRMMSAPMKQELFGFIQGRAARLGSETLALLAANLAAPSADPFVKIRGMISDLVTKLEAEAKAEAKEHDWCNAELTANKKTREELESSVSRLNSEIEASTAKINGYGTDMKEQSETMAQLTTTMNDATKVRTDEKAVNTQTIADSKAAQEAIDTALTILRDFYDKAKSQMATTSQTMAGQQEGASGVVGMIEVLQTDFARLQADTEASEAKAAAEYDDLMSASKVEHENTREDHVETEAKKTKENNRNRRLKKDLKNTNAQLDNANTANSALQEQCIETKLSYEERVALRDQEIASLQEALAMLEGEAE